MHLAARFPLCRTACAALLLTQLGACMTWRPVPGTQTGAEPISRARLRTRNGTELFLHDVAVRGDSVIGYTESPRERRALLTADVASVDRRQLSVGRTTALVVGVAALTTFVAAGLAVRDFGGSINAVPTPRVP